MAKDYSGWGSDDKGEPMVMASSGGGGGSSSESSGGGGKVTQAVLAIAMVLALVLAGYAMVQVGRRDTKITELGVEHGKAIDAWKGKLAIAQNYIDEEKGYVKALQNNNACLFEKGKARCPDAPQPTITQAYVDELRAFNAERRNTTKKATSTPPRPRDPFPPEPK